MFFAVCFFFYVLCRLFFFCVERTRSVVLVKMVYEDLYAPRGEGMQFNSILDEEPPFNPKFGSYFSYSKVPGSDEFTSSYSSNKSSTNLTSFQSFCRVLVLSLTILLVCCTLPFSLYFCLKVRISILSILTHCSLMSESEVARKMYHLPVGTKTTSQRARIGYYLPMF